ncbi:MAG TPA: hypothetical protein VHM19_14035, partial [Polyangiales bacterium]|nr:hypothetical protein [Polyangiales bacterium]
MSAQILTLKLPALEAVPLAEQLPVGRLIEIARTADGAQMTMAVACVRQAQTQGEPVAWVQRAGGALFPPDLVDSGIDLDALVVVHVPNAHAGSTQEQRTAAEHGLAKAAELLLRSGAFGMVVIDLTSSPGTNSASYERAQRAPREGGPP